ncbi:MAG: hypothetical protein DRH44_07100 [Candidatus Coatesbacteria bacterium]|nr:MAG: hypothetical protein DRH44_07100 [Candidatus Coatesbacteria bacterium]
MRQVALSLIVCVILLSTTLARIEDRVDLITDRPYISLTTADTIAVSNPVQLKYNIMFTSRTLNGFRKNRIEVEFHFFTDKVYDIEDILITGLGDETSCRGNGWTVHADTIVVSDEGDPSDRRCHIEKLTTVMTKEQFYNLFVVRKAKYRAICSEGHIDFWLEDEAIDEIKEFWEMVKI